MSLTSYRAAPPRAKCKTLWVLSRCVNREAVYATAGAKPNGFCSCKGRTIYLALVPLNFNWPLKAKGRLRGPMFSAWAEDVMRRFYVAFSRPGSDRLSRVLRRSTIGAGAFHGRVRNGNGCSRPAITTRSAKRNFEKLVRPVRPRFSLEHALASSV